MFLGATDLWLSPQEFLELRCSDWEEHAILLTNYFNKIDSFMYEKQHHPQQQQQRAVPSTPSGWMGVVCPIQSYVVIGQGVPQGEAAYVMRQVGSGMNR